MISLCFPPTKSRIRLFISVMITSRSVAVLSGNSRSSFTRAPAKNVALGAGIVGRGWLEYLCAKLRLDSLEPCTKYYGFALRHTSTCTVTQKVYYSHRLPHDKCTTHKRSCFHSISLSLHSRGRVATYRKNMLLCKILFFLLPCTRHSRFWLHTLHCLRRELPTFRVCLFFIK